LALSTFDGLKTAVGTWLARSGDTQITNNVADFITLADAYLNRNLRVRPMETGLTFTTTSGERNLPDDYLAWRRMTWLGDTYVSLEYLQPDVFNRWYPAAEEGTPRVFTIEGNTLKIRPTDDTTSFSFLYYAKIPAMEDDDDSNWVLESHPDLYLAATLAEANAFLVNPDHAALWAQKRDALIAQLQMLSEKTKGPARVIPVGPYY
jgi:hypothetical protein